MQRTYLKHLRGGDIENPCLLMEIRRLVVNVEWIFTVQCLIIYIYGAGEIDVLLL